MILLQISEALGISKELQLGIVGFVLIIGIFGLVRLILIMDRRYNRRVKEHAEERKTFYEKMEQITDKSNVIHKEIQAEQTVNMNTFANTISRMEGMFLAELKRDK